MYCRITLAGGVTLAVGTILPWIEGYAPELRRELTNNLWQYDWYTAGGLVFVGGLIVYFAIRTYFVSAAIAAAFAGIWIFSTRQMMGTAPAASVQWGLYVSALGVAMAIVAGGLANQEKERLDWKGRYL